MITLQQAIEDIKKANPIFGGLLDSDQPLIEYAKECITSYKPNPIHKGRQKGYIAAIKKEVDRLFPNSEVNVNWDEELILDTTDHHNIINFPAIVGAHLLTRFDTILDRENHGDYFVLDTGNVPFTEVLHRRGVEFAGKHINLFPKKDRNKLTSHYPIFRFEFVQSARNSEHTFTDEEWRFLQHLDDVAQHLDLTSCEDFADQIVKLNLALWEEMFSEEIRDQARRCLTLEHNKILHDYWQTFFLGNQDCFVWKMLFDPATREYTLQEGKGVYGAWDYGKKGTGTHFFWGITPDSRMTPMWLDGAILKDSTGQVEDIPMSPEAIVAALKKRIIAPSIFTKFSFVAFYLGAKVMGGPGQTEYVPKIKNAIIRILDHMDPAEAELVRQVPAETMNAIELIFHKNKNGEIMKDWGLDAVMRHAFSKEYLDRLALVPVKASIIPFVPISHYRLTPADQRQPIDYTEQDLFAGFDWVT